MDTNIIGYRKHHFSFIQFIAKISGSLIPALIIQIMIPVIVIKIGSFNRS
jgi:hypothetical protein